MNCSHQIRHVALEKDALGSAYLKVTLCNECPQVWIDTGFPLTEEFIEHTHRERCGHIRPATAAGVSLRQS